MLPYVYLFGVLPIPMYGLMAVIGFAVSLLVAMKLAPVYRLNRLDLGFASVFLIIGIIVGSKLLYFITYIPALVKNFDLFLKNPWAVIMIVFGGFVFYGGLIGGAVAVWLYARYYKISVFKFADVIAPVIPLFHAFGRIGCFLGGCCYGIEYHGFGAISFPYNELTPELNEVSRFPVQLVESGLNFILFIILFSLAKKRRKPGFTLGVYLLSYSVIRMGTEIFRGDIARGVYGPAGISTSQIISLLLIPLGIWLVLRKNPGIQDDADEGSVTQK